VREFKQTKGGKIKGVDKGPAYQGNGKEKKDWSKGVWLELRRGVIENGRFVGEGRGCPGQKKCNGAVR